MTGPFVFLREIGDGDYIEIGQMRAHSPSLRYDFGGFLPAGFAIVKRSGPAFT
jgi:hypothetical protein